MYQKARFRHGRTSEAKILEMGYQGGDLTLVIVLPHKKDGLAALEKGFKCRSNHPFLFFIRHKKTGSILFVGRLADPR